MSSAPQMAETHPPSEIDDEEDAEGEIDDTMDAQSFATGRDTHAMETDNPQSDRGEIEAEVDYEHAEQDDMDKAGEDEDEDADGDGDEDADGDGDEDEGEGVGPVKLPGSQIDVESDEGILEGDSASGNGDSDADEEDEAPDDSNDDESSSSGSDVECDWEGASDREERDGEGGLGAVNPNRCIFCGEDEDKDPSEDFEEYLACAVCGDNSHRQCARDAQSLTSENEPEQWRCPACVENNLEPAAGGSHVARGGSSAPNIARELFPSQRGATNPDSHSVFNQLIVNEDPMDGSRMLRKRKASTIDSEDDFSLSGARTRKRGRVSRSFSGRSARSGDTVPDDDHPKGNVMAMQDEVLKETTELAHDARYHRGVPTQNGARLSRPRREKKLHNPLVRVVKRRKRSHLILCFNLESAALSRILATGPNPEEPRARSPASPQLDQFRDYATPYATQYATPFYSFHERENDELKSKPYGGILSEVDADTSKTMPDASDRQRFDEAMQKAEEEWKQKLMAATNGNSDRKPKVAGPASKIQCINFGGWEIDTWYAAPYPEEYSRNRVLYICEFCLKYMSSEYVGWRHKLKCPAKHPPGDEIYREGSVSVFEVDGRKNPVYCQNLCLLAKLFLGSKTLYYDVEPFLFYVMTESDEFGCHFVGYFSKEKRPSSSNNVSCILTLPIHQRKGYGNLLIDFSYLLTRVQQKTGSPEKPLSDMGLVSYRNYWRLVLSYQLRDQKTPITIIELSRRTGMTADDIVAALEGLRALVRDPITGTYALRLDYDYLANYVKKWEAKKYVRLKPRSLIWTPYIIGRSHLVNFESTPGLATTVHGENDDEEGEEVEGHNVDSSERGNAAEERPLVLLEGRVQLQIHSQITREMDLDSPTPFPSLPIGTSTEKSEVNLGETNAFPLTPAPTTIASVDHPDDASQLHTETAPHTGIAHPSTSSSPTTASTIPSSKQAPAIPPSRYEVYPPLPTSGKKSTPGPRRHRASAPFASLGRRRTGGTGGGGRGAHSTAKAVAASALARRKRKEAAAAAAAAAAIAATTEVPAIGAIDVEPRSLGGKDLEMIMGKAKLRATRSVAGMMISSLDGANDGDTPMEDRSKIAPNGEGADGFREAMGHEMHGIANNLNGIPQSGVETAVFGA